MILLVLKKTLKLVSLKRIVIFLKCIKIKPLRPAIIQPAVQG